MWNELFGKVDENGCFTLTDNDKKIELLEKQNKIYREERNKVYCEDEKYTEFMNNIEEQLTDLRKTDELEMERHLNIVKRGYMRKINDLEEERKTLMEKTLRNKDEIYRIKKSKYIKLFELFKIKVNESNPHKEFIFRYILKSKQHIIEFDEKFEIFDFEIGKRSYETLQDKFMDVFRKNGNYEYLYEKLDSIMDTLDNKVVCGNIFENAEKYLEEYNYNKQHAQI